MPMSQAICRSHSAAAMPSLPSARGMVSGILQCGYPAGYLLAAVVYGLLYGQKIGEFTFGWRAMFLLSFVPALIVLGIAGLGMGVWVVRRR